MSKKILYLRWQDGRCVPIELWDNPVSEWYWDCTKYLQHLELSFNVRKNPYHPLVNDSSALTNLLTNKALELALLVIPEKLTDKTYLNYLHTVYVDHVSRPGFDVGWLEFHDLLHALETSVGSNLRTKDIWIDFEERAGPLIKKFDRALLKYATVTREPGVCYIAHHELGKDPFTYYNDREPRDIDTMCQLMKPWIDLKPALNIETSWDSLHHRFRDVEKDFATWFGPYRQAWCDYHELDDWCTDEIFMAIPIGRTQDVSTLIDAFSKQDYPVKISR
jgi:hypothetical protein